MHTSTIPVQPTVAWRVDELQEATQGIWHHLPETSVIFQRILTDSRHVNSEDVFLALKGERHDGHDFVRQLSEQGVGAVIVDHALDIDIPQLVVKDTRRALGDLGVYRRRQYPNLKVVALTGSSGKTTTKEMLGHILAQLGETLVTRGNLNNDLGVPLMLLELCPEHQYAVLELGANHVGEIDYTASLVQAQVAAVLNIGTAHMGEFGGRDAIARAKSEIYRHLSAQGTAIVPMQDDYSLILQQASQAHHQLKFGGMGDVYATNIQLFEDHSVFDLNTPQGSISVTLPFVGRHNISNAEAAAACASALDVPLAAIASGLASVRPVPGRLNFKRIGQVTIIDDTYNANPTSMRAAASVLVQQQAVRIMVMGDIAELGDDAEHEHYQLGCDLAALPIHYLCAVGEFAASTFRGAQHCTTAIGQTVAFESQSQALHHLQTVLGQYSDQPVAILFKGSRSAKMELLMADLVRSM